MWGPNAALNSVLMYDACVDDRSPQALSFPQALLAGQTVLGIVPNGIAWFVEGHIGIDRRLFFATEPVRY